MDDVVKIRNAYYIRAHSSLADASRRVLKNADLFAVFDKRGTIRPLGFEDHGLFHRDTRHLSRWVLHLNRLAPLLLSSNVKEANECLVVDLTNADFTDETGQFIRRGTVHLERVIFLWRERLFEKLTISHFGQQPVRLNLGLEFDADFADIFEVRGLERKARGTLRPPSREGATLVLSYRGLDNRTRQTRISCAPAPGRFSGKTAQFQIHLEPRSSRTLEITCDCRSEEEAAGAELSAAEAFRANQQTYSAHRETVCVLETSNEQFNDWINRSRADLHMLITRTEHGLYPYAGIPWFNTVFGRDGIITALQTVWFFPELAKGVLTHLAHTQADRRIPEQGAEPGKVLHETRQGEMAALGEVPFGRYYGSVDATPLFVVLAGHYAERTGDVGLIERLWPRLEAALAWIDRYGDSDGDGFVEYARGAEGGLFNQGWKDSEDSVFHADGETAGPPIALCEVQGYVYEAKLRAAELAARLGRSAQAASLRKSAEALRKRFLEAFWMEDLGTYALALDGQKKTCRVKSSNAGHCLFSGIADPDQAVRIAEDLAGGDFFTGWGVRTLARSQARYNPMSYHNGSVWPHDNALIACGMARYGRKEEALRVMTGLFDASLFLDLHRLPELFCGFERRKGEGPTLYPVACDPQAWAAGAVFLLLQSCLGLSILAPQGRVVFNRPDLPPYLEQVRIRGLRVGNVLLDLVLQRHKNDVGVNVEKKTGPIDLLVAK